MAKKKEEAGEVKVELISKSESSLKYKKISSEGISFSTELDKAGIVAFRNDSIVFDLKQLPADFDFSKHTISGKVVITLEAKDKE
ncbi:MAG: hypothetical protein PHS33_08070 [Candidatus Omnitrophica bacterium]|nr:hypothetical protein [Candidatus Omnitrophota bacterium]MDD5264698.1 hypothetical protein [Candidatus Bipolaricaulis sp.]